jgi:C-terminal processing protease CtpA/Prc
LKISSTESTDLVSSDAIFKKYPPVTEVITKNISPTISAIIPISLYGNTTSTYPIADSVKFNKLLVQVNSISARTSADLLEVRLGDVIIAWNIFKHFFPYWEDASENPERILRNAVSKSLTDKTALDFKYTLQLMTAALNDGHIWVSLTNDSSQLYTAPLILEYAENKLVVERVLDNKVANTVNTGDVITSIDGIATERFIEEKERFLSGSPQWKRYRSKISILAGAYNSTVKLIIDGSKSISLIRNLPSNDLYREIGLRRATGKIEEGIYYVDINATPMDTIELLLPSLQKAKAIIFDLRGYPRGNHGVINHLMKTSESARWMFIPKIIYPDYQQVTYDSIGWDMQPESPRLDGKIIFITDGRAISYAESFMGYIKDLHLATIVGQPTAGTNGDVNPFSLPGGYRISWTGMLVKNHDGSKHHLNGIIPDIIVTRTIKGIKEGRDELLEKAIEVAEAENNIER